VNVNQSSINYPSKRKELETNENGVQTIESGESNFQEPDPKL
jgi:hypothetical protein